MLETTHNFSSEEFDPSGSDSLRMPQYTYNSLESGNNIRLLKIQPGSGHQSLICTLSHYDLEHVYPPYEAISYTWGDSPDRTTIQIACDLKHRQLSVTKSCDSILRRLRRPESARLVWVDAVCINQTDIPERNSQVAIMSHIYRSAVRVMIDIGETSQESDLAIDALINWSGERLYGFEEGLAIKRAVCNLYERPWFHRVWVLQEVFMSKEAVVICGLREVPWGVFRFCRIWVDSRPAWETEHWHVELPKAVPLTLQVGTHNQREYTARTDLLSLLCKGRMSDATDPRDKVFAIFNMLENATVEGLVADYSKLNTTARVYIEIATWLLEKFGLSFLSCVHGESKLAGLPSWVPDWSSKVRPEWIIGISDTYWPLSASGNTRAAAGILNISDELPTLKLRGFVVDVICATQKWTMAANHDTEEIDQFVLRSFHQEENCSGWWDHLPIKNLPVYAQRWEPRTNEKRIHPSKWAQIYGLPLDLNGDETDNDICDLYAYFCCGQQLIMSEKRYFGVCAETAEPGDLICIFLGAKVPFILREAEEHFKFIGESYVYGLMMGEALLGKDIEAAYGKDPVSPFQDFLIY